MSNGDSSTICVGAGVTVQIDLNHLESAEDDDNARTPIVDVLVPLLPKVRGKPYLSAFVLTHPDQDHCKGFAELRKKVTIGELWFSPRVFSEFKGDLCDDAVAFSEEARRRLKLCIAGQAASGDRIRVVGAAEVLDEDDFDGLPEDRLTIPGTAITEVDGVDHGDTLRIFVHAPFKDDSDGERNDTSIGLQVTLTNGDQQLRGLFLGDLCCPTITRIFDVSDDDDLSWNVFLAPHHCSKSVMYWADSEEEEEALQEDLLQAIGNAALSPGYVVLSSEPCPTSNEKGDNPPHAIAKAQYEEIAPDGVLCTHEHGDVDAPEPIVFALTEAGIIYSAPNSQEATAKSLAEAVALARGTNEPPQQRVGFGRPDA